MSRSLMAISLFVISGFFATVLAAEESVQSATEQTPDPVVQGKTSSNGPQKMDLPFLHHHDKDAEQPAERKETRAEPRVETRAEPVVSAPKHEEKVEHRETVAETRHQSDEKPKEYTQREKEADAYAASAVATAAAAAEARQREVAAARERLEMETRIRSAIRRLGSSGWREASVELVAARKDAIPYLIDAMSGSDAAAPAYYLGGHTKADAGHSTRQRPLSEVCADILTEIVSQHSNYSGELPTLDPKAWQTWWAANSGTITFGSL